MVVGFDTGFFIKLLKGSDIAVKVWKEVRDKNTLAVVSSLTLFELHRLSLKGKINKDFIDDILNGIPLVCKIIWLDNINVFSFGANISHGTGIPAIDSLILAGLVLENVEIIYTTDSHFESYQKKGLKILKME